jgi:hypothetical protein
MLPYRVGGLFQVVGMHDAAFFGKMSSIVVASTTSRHDVAFHHSCVVDSSRDLPAVFSTKPAVVDYGPSVGLRGDECSLRCHAHEIFKNKTSFEIFGIENAE